MGVRVEGIGSWGFYINGLRVEGLGLRDVGFRA